MPHVQVGQNPIVVLPFFDEESIANEPEFMQQTGSDDEVNLLRNIDESVPDKTKTSNQARKLS